MENEKIRIKIAGGYLVAERNPDPDFDGVTVYYETDDGNLADIVLVEAKAMNDYKQIDVYSYTDEFSEDWTTKTIVNTDNYKAAFER